MLKEKILDLISNNEPYSFDMKMIAKHFKMEKTKEFVELNKAMSSLEMNYQIIRNNSNFYSLALNNNVFEARYRVNMQYRGFVEVNNERYFIKDKNINKALHMDEVLVLLKPDDNSEIIEVIKRHKDYMVGTFKYRKGKLKFIPDNIKDHRDIKITNPLNLRFKEDMKVKAEIGKVTSDEICLKINSIIGNIHDKGMDITSILLENDVRMEFSKKINNALEDYPTEIKVSANKNRQDLTNVLTMTIDGDDAKDYDDAISIQKYNDYYNLKVHIADVTHYVKFNDVIDKEAYERGTSIYVCDRVVPMLPFKLSNELCSLMPNVNRMALTCDMDIDFNGDIKDYRFYEAIINSDYRMTYNNVNKILKNDEEQVNKYADIKDTVDTMLELSLKIRAKRFNKGAIDFEKDEAKIILDKKGRAVDIKLRERDEAEKLIEDFMVLANECVARHMKWMNIPSLYRVHEEPKEAELERFKDIMYIFGYKFKGKNITSIALQNCLNEFKEHDEYPVIKELLLKSMKKAIYSEECLGHFGLGLEEYTHFTSPIRRYPDLIVHRMLKKYVINNDNMKHIDKDYKLMMDYAKKSSENERKAVSVERLVDDMKKAEYMEKHVGEIFEGTISSVLGFGFFVELSNTIEGLIHIRTLDGHYEFDEKTVSLKMYDENNMPINVYQLGQKIQVKVSKVDRKNGKIDFELVRFKRKKRNRWI